ncbi:MAG: DUF1501 domain-containing protein [Candidatus Hydrogenedentes bacterium]|nr:DUF1501 domain-containing protein [Candidatus Hydrogenedentota bacterium]
MSEAPAPCTYDFGRGQTALTRREFLQRSGAGFGWLGLAGLLQQQQLLAEGAVSSFAARAPHFAPRAKSVIFLFMYGGPSGFDLFDYKPELNKHDGQKLDWKGEIETFNPNPGPLMKSPYSFKQYGQSGAWVSEKYTALAQHIDDMALIKSCYCESNNHAPALFQMNTGMIRVGFPSIGSWLVYGLGTENQDLPGYVVMYDHRGGPIGGPQNWGNGFLPSSYQATPFRASGTPILNLKNERGLGLEQQRAQLDLLGQLNAAHQAAHPGEADLLARVESYELAFRMQMEAPEAVDISRESERTHCLYGLDREITRPFGTQCLIARRLVERGVRFVQLYSGGGHQQDSWDAHFGLKVNHDLHCAETDVPMAGLLADLKQRGLLDQTLVVWGGEFGRMPMSQGGVGRDHNPEGFLMWMAGGGIKGGVSHGETDEVGYKAALHPVSVHDLHATMLHVLGMDHTRLTYFHNGREFRLTDVAGNVIQPVVA